MWKLSPETTKLILTRHLGGYGLGIRLGGEDTVTNFTHGGANDGYRCILFGYIERGQGAVVMTNGDHGDALFNEILRSIRFTQDLADRCKTRSLKPSSKRVPICIPSSNSTDSQQANKFQG